MTTQIVSVEAIKKMFGDSAVSVTTEKREEIEKQEPEAQLPPGVSVVTVPPGTLKLFDDSVDPCPYCNRDKFSSRGSRTAHVRQCVLNPLREIATIACEKCGVQIATRSYKSHHLPNCDGVAEHTIEKKKYGEELAMRKALASKAGKPFVGKRGVNLYTKNRKSSTNSLAITDSILIVLADHVNEALPISKMENKLGEFNSHQIHTALSRLKRGGYTTNVGRGIWIITKAGFERANKIKSAELMASKTIEAYGLWEKEEEEMETFVAKTPKTKIQAVVSFDVIVETMASRLGAQMGTKYREFLAWVGETEALWDSVG